LQILTNKEKDSSSNISQKHDFFLKQDKQDVTDEIEIPADNADLESI